MAAAAGTLCDARQFHQLRGDAGDAALGVWRKNQRVTVDLKNDDDISMYATIKVGESPMRCIMDTGSAEQVVFSSKCKGCGEHMYNCDKDDQCTWGPHVTVQSYGSGDTHSTEAYTSVTATSIDGKSNITVPDQMVWLVTEAELDFELDGTMQCIFGLGPAESAVEFAKMDYQMLKDYMDSMPAQDAKQWKPMLKDLKNHITFMNGVSLWQEAAKFDTMSFCLHPEFGKDGRLFINDDAPEAAPDAFIETKAAGLYWQVDMTKINIPFHNNALTACKAGSSACAAIMDTGTSLIGAPAAFVADLSQILEESMPKYGCEPDALNNYPDFELSLDGHKIHLPPRSYVCKFDAADWGDEDEDDWGGDDDDDLGDWNDDWRRSGGKKGPHVRHVRKRMRHVHAFKEAHERHILETRKLSKPDETADDGQFFCAPCLFDLDQEQEGVEEWLFGLPFFREYYTSFRTNKEGTQAKNVLFAKSNSKCKPEGGRSQEDDKVLRASGVQRVKMHKLHIPSSKSTKNRPSGRAKALMARLHK